MYTHYLAKCDSCGEAKEIYVNGPNRTYHMLSERDTDIQTFLLKHYGCRLELIHNDCELEKLWAEGYVADYDTHEYVRI